MSALSKVGMSVFSLLVVRFGGCGSDGCTLANRFGMDETSLRKRISRARKALAKAFLEKLTLPAAADPFGPVKGGEFELAAGAVGEPLIGRSPGCPTGFGRPQACYVLSPTMPAPSDAKSDGLTHPGRGTLKWEIAARPLTAY
jgi:hypothetical protein